MENHSELVFKGGIARACKNPMQSQLQQAIRVSKCKACDEGHAYRKDYWMQFNKQ